jgi:hypothetical protein
MLMRKTAYRGFCRTVRIAVFGLMSGLVFQATLPIGLCEGADASALFTVDVNQQKANIEKEFAKIDEWLPVSKLQDIRSTIRTDRPQNRPLA